MRTEFGGSPHLFRYILGYTDIALAPEKLPDVLNLCRREGISYYDALATDERGCIRLPFFRARRLKGLLSEQNIAFTELGSHGIPALILKHRLRLGVPVGMILSILLLIFSGRFVWDVRVDGTQRLTADEVVDALEECGLSVGSRISSLDPSVIENRVLILSDDIAWITVNLRGTVASVQIRETIPLPEEEPSGASNLVAERGGVIVRLEDIRGSTVAVAGESVSEGQLLVSGIVGGEDTGMSYVRAEGRIYAECEQSFEVEVPRSYRKKEYTGRVKYEKYLIFFKKEIKFFSNCGNLYTTYDKIDMVEYFPSPSGDDLPVGIRTVKYMEYVYTEQTRSDSELCRLAEYRMSLELWSKLRDAELLKKTTRFELRDDRYILICKVKCIKDIAKQKEIEITP